MALYAKHLDFEQLHCAPHSAEALEYNPLGQLPALVDRSYTPPLVLCESLAIAAYLDRCSPIPMLSVPHGADEHHTAPERVTELAARAATALYPALEFGFVKPLVAAIDAGESLEDKLKGLTKEQERLADVLDVFEAHFTGPRAGEGFLLGQTLTLADCMLYPLVADLRAVAPGKTLLESGGKDGAKRYKHLVAWLEHMDTQAVVKATRDGTLELGGRP